jgi:hypothetical protein
MHFLPNTDLASLSSMPPVMWVMMLPISLFIVMGIVGIVALAMKNMERGRWHETARIALEKGVPVPNMPVAPLVVNAPLSQHKQRMGLITGGLVNIAIGIGVYLGLSSIDDAREARLFGLIPSFIGVALIAGAAIDIHLSRKLTDPGDTTPKS